MQKIPGFAAIVSPKSSKAIRTIEDLRGRTIGVTAPGNAYHRVLDRILLLHGVKPEEVSVVGVGNGPSIALAMERGRVDPGLGADLTISYLDRRFPDLTFLFDTRTATGVKAALATEEMAFFILCARTGWLDAQSQTARKVAGATNVRPNGFRITPRSRFVKFFRKQTCPPTPKPIMSGSRLKRERPLRTAV